MSVAARLHAHACPKKQRLQWITISVLAIFTLLYLFPVYLMVVNGFKTEPELTISQIALPHSLYLDNLMKAVKVMDYPRALLNNLIICGGVLGILIPFSAMAAYPMAKRMTRFNKKMYLYYLVGVIVPAGVTLVPVYVLLRSLHLFNYLGLILIYTSKALPWAIFMYTGFMMALPKQLEDAAVIDGCNDFTAFWRIMFPLVKNGTITVATLNLLGAWNDFLMPMLILTKKEQRTLLVKLFLFKNEYYYEYGPMFAGLLLVTLPFLIFFLIGQKYVIKGVVAGAIKG